MLYKAGYKSKGCEFLPLQPDVRHTLPNSPKPNTEAFYSTTTNQTKDESTRAFSNSYTRGTIDRYSISRKGL